MSIPRDSDRATIRIEVITSVERRRRWSRLEKERWVSALMEPGANASDIAPQAAIERTLLYRWRRQLAGSRKPASSIPIRIAPMALAAITIELACCARLKIDGALDGETLAKVVGALSTSARRAGGAERVER